MTMLLSLAALAACTTTTVHGVTSVEYLPAQNDDGIVIHFAGGDALFVDPKDEGLRRALGFVRHRIGELPEEIGPQVPAEPILLALDVVGGAWTLRAGLRPEDPDAPPGPPFYASLTLEGEDARERGGRLLDMLAGMGLPLGEPDERGLRPLDLQGMPAMAGEVDLGGEAAWTFAVTEAPTAPLDLGSLDLPAGVRPIVAWKLDFGQYLDLVSSFGGMGGGPMAGMQVLDFLDGMRLVGGHGLASDRAVTTTRMLGYVPMARDLELLPSGPLRAATLKMVPRDATWASLGVVRFAGYPQMLRGMLESVGMPAEEDPIEGLFAATGVHLEADVFDHLGEAFGVYTSDATGGGGWLSLVAFLEVANAEGLSETIAELVARVGHLARTETKGYIQLVPRAHGDHELMTLAFPGLPVPLEVSFGMEGGFLFLGLSPQSVAAAMDQARAGGASLLDQPAVREAVGSELAGVYGLTWSDTPRLAREGYGMTSLFGAALANATSSPRDPGRYAGPVVPSFERFVQGIRPQVGVTRLVGEDMVSVIQSDRSMLVNVAATTALLGDVWLFAAVAGMGSSLAMPSVVQQIDSARSAKAMADMTQIMAALNAYAIENDLRFPDSLQVLVTPDESGLRYLDRAEVPLDPWGRPYVYLPPSTTDARPRVMTLGADGAPGGFGENADLSYP